MAHDAGRPAHRFAGETGVLDLDEHAGELLDVARQSASGHAQRTLYRHHGASVAMFAFEPDGRLPTHQVDGVVTVQPLSGEISVTASGESRPLRPGRLLRMVPGVSHDVQAKTRAVILVHIQLMDGDARLRRRPGG